MSLKVEGQSCPVCHAYLFDEDDIVYCPVCGAPHHRDCYNHIGHCALEADHGTEREYSRVRSAQELEKQSEKEPVQPADASDTVNEIICPACHETYPRDSRTCPKCGAANVYAMRGLAAPDPYGAIPPDYDIGDGVTAKQAAKFVLSSSNRYVPKFAQLKGKAKLSWNWAAFLLPHGWLLFRKMYKAGIAAALLSVAFTICMYPFQSELNQLMGDSVNNYYALAMQLPTYLAGISLSSKILAGISAVLQLALSVVCGLFGDALYRRHTISSIKKISDDGIEPDDGFRKYGNVSPLMFLAGLLITTYLPYILLIFI